MIRTPDNSVEKEFEGKPSNGVKSVATEHALDTKDGDALSPHKSLVVTPKPSESFPEETSIAEILAMKKPTVELFATQIGLRWQKSVKGIFEVAQLAAHAVVTLKYKEKKRLMDLLHMKKSYFSKLVRIGCDKRLKEPEVFQLLRPNISFIYTMTLWPDAEVAAYVRDEKSGKAATAMAIHGQKKWHVDSRRIPRAADRVLVFASETTADQVREIDAALDELARKYRVQVDSYSGSAFGPSYILGEGFPRTISVADPM